MARLLDGGPRHVVHLAAQAGVRYSLENPAAYAHSNLTGMTCVLEACRRAEVEHLIYASSSSVYGSNAPVPFREDWPATHPSSFYAATKRSNETMAHAFSHLYGLPTTGLRFFTVYGPWGRPDMAYWMFADAILSGRPIRVFNHGDMSRDFTYIDDVVEGVIRLISRPAPPDPGWTAAAARPDTSYVPYEIFNVGNNAPVRLMDMIALLEDILGRAAVKEFVGMQPGDVPTTYADIDKLAAAIGFAPRTELRTGLERFADWFLAHRGPLGLGG
jgi:UDP-glucuronate 4-epimerase